MLALRFIAFLNQLYVSGDLEAENISSPSCKADIPYVLYTCAIVHVYDLT
jgi:hypothetical protein